MSSELESEYRKLAEDAQKNIRDNTDDYYPLEVLEMVYQLWWRWANFELYIVSPTFTPIHPPTLILPEKIEADGFIEPVYPIQDHGYKLSTSKATEMYHAGMSMYKLHMTIEKMIYLLIEKLKDTGTITKETEVQIAFGGHELAQRKAFESVINLDYNVIITNFDPGAWGNHYLENIKRLASKFGYPPEAPRDTYRKPVTKSGKPGLGK